MALYKSFIFIIFIIIISPIVWWFGALLSVTGRTTTIDDAVDQWQKRLHCSVETSGRHVEHLLLQHCHWNLSNLGWLISWYLDTSLCYVILRASRDVIA